MGVICAVLLAYQFLCGRVKRWQTIPAMVFGAIGAAVGVSGFVHVMTVGGDTDNFFGKLFAEAVNPGAGMYFAMLGGILVVLANIGLLLSRPFQWAAFFVKRVKSPTGETGQMAWGVDNRPTSIPILAGVAGVVVIIFAGTVAIVASRGETDSGTGSGQPAIPFISHDVSDEEMRAEVKELEAKLAQAEKDKKELAKFKVLKSRYYKATRFGSSDGAFELTVHNETSHPISRVHFRLTLASPGRAIPWVADELSSYRIRGGLEPGEQATWQLDPLGGDWDEAPEDAVLTLEVTRLDGPKDKVLFSSEGFTKSDRKRLAELKNKLGIR